MLSHLRATLTNGQLHAFFPHTDPHLPRRVLIGWAEEQTPSYSWRGLERPDGPVGIFQYTIRGRGVLERAGERYLLDAGQAFLVEVPDDHHYYLPAGWEPWEFCFIVFDGDDLLRHARWILAQHGPVLALGETHPVLSAFTTLCATLAGDTVTDAEALSTTLYPFMMALRRVAGPPQRRPSPPVARAMQFAARRYHEPLDIGLLARIAGLSRAHFCRLFHQETGQTPSNYVTHLRLQRACSLLRGTQLPVDIIAGQCGFAGASYFGKVFHKVFGIAPSAYRDGTAPLYTPDR